MLELMCNDYGNINNGAFISLYQARSNKQMNLVLRTLYQGPWSASHGQGAKDPGPSLPKYTHQGNSSTFKGKS
jgi:hypothetical protein